MMAKEKRWNLKGIIILFQIKTDVLNFENSYVERHKLLKSCLQVL